MNGSAILLTTVTCMLFTSVYTASDPKALNTLKLIADVLYKSPANNAFIEMVERNQMDSGIVSLVEGMAAKFAARDACTQFKNSAPKGRRELLDNFVPHKVQRRTDVDLNELLVAVSSNLHKDPEESVENLKQILESLDEKVVKQKRTLSDLIASAVMQKRQDDEEKELLDLLNSKDGQDIINKKASGKKLDIPPPLFSSGGVPDSNLGRRKRQVATSGSNISKGQHAGFSTKATALLARVRNIVKNNWSRQLFIKALDDGTLRAAMYNICRCNYVANTLRQYYDLGKF